MNPYGAAPGTSQQPSTGPSSMGARPLGPPSSGAPFSGALPFAPPPTSGYSSAPPPPLLGRPPLGGMLPRYGPPPYNPMLRPHPGMHGRPPSMLPSSMPLSRPLSGPPVNSSMAPRPVSLPVPMGTRPPGSYSLAEIAAKAVGQLAPLPLPEKPHTTLYVGKIAPTVDDAFLKKVLELCGTIKSWKRAQDPSTQVPKGFGFCEFESAEGVLRALRLLNKFSLEGQELVLNVNQATRDYLERYVAKKRQVSTGPRIEEAEEKKEPADGADEPLKDKEREPIGLLLKDERGDKQSDGPREAVSQDLSEKQHEEKVPGDEKAGVSEKAPEFLGERHETKAGNDKREGGEHGKEKLKETDEELKEEASRKLGLVLISDREGDEEALKEIKRMVDERVKLLPPPPPSLPSEVTAALKATQRLKDSSEAAKHGEPAHKAGDTDSEQKVTLEGEKEDAMSADRRKRSSHREKEKAREHEEKETEYARIERERERERTRRERERERSHRDAERLYADKESDWEKREKEMERRRQHDREREKERERERRHTIKEQEEESEEDEWRRRHGHLGEEAARRRMREEEDDEMDALKEEQELAEAKRRRLEEETKAALRVDAATAMEVEARAQPSRENGHVADEDAQMADASVSPLPTTTFVKLEIPPVVLPPLILPAAVRPASPIAAAPPPLPRLPMPAPSGALPAVPLARTLPVLPEEAPLPVPVAATLVREATAQAREREMEAEGPKKEVIVSNGRPLIKIEKEGSLTSFESARAAEAKKKLGFGLPGSSKLSLAAAFGEEEDDTVKVDKMRPLVPIDYGEEVEFGGVWPSSGPGVQSATAAPPVGGGDGMVANIAAAAEYAKRLSQIVGGGAGTPGKEPKEEAEHRQQDKVRASDSDRGRKEERKAKTSEVKPFRDAKSLIDTIPKTKEELFSYPVDWDIYDKHNLHSRMRPWIQRKIKEFLGEEEMTLVDFIVRNTQEHVTGAAMLELLEPILDDEAEMFVLKMWRMLIFEIRRIETGLANQGK